MLRFAFWSILAAFTLAGAPWAQGLTDVSPFKRPTLNMNFVYQEAAGTYPFLDLFLGHDAVPDPSWATGTVWNSDVLDANGYPCSFSKAAPGCVGVNPVTGRNWSIGFSIPSNANYPSVFCLQGIGTGTYDFVGVGGHPLVFDAAGTQTCPAFKGGLASNCTSSYATVRVTRAGLSFASIDDDSQGWCLAFRTNTNNVIYQNPLVASLRVNADDPHNKGAYVRGLHLYEIGDGTDLAAGKVYRSAWKHEIVALDPAFIRLMNWSGGNNSPEVRWENRATPTNQIGISGGYLVKPFLAYNNSTSNTNTYSIGAAAGTPISMQHGEVAYLRIGNASTGGTQGQINAFKITAISNDGNITGEVTTSTNCCSTIPLTSNAISTGDIVIMSINGMPSLNDFPACANVIDATHFEIFKPVYPATATCTGAKIDVSAMGRFTSGMVMEGYMLNVGSRGWYPIVRLSLLQPPGAFRFTVPNAIYPWAFAETLASGRQYYFTFNKNISGMTDGSGNPIYGAWVVGSSQQLTTSWPVPAELETKMIIELNALKPAHPINMWVNTGPTVLIPNDPDYSTASDYPGNLINAILNGANGYQGLATGCPQCVVVVEDSNETWNSTFDQTTYFPYLGTLYCSMPYNDTDQYSTYHSELVMQDIKKSGYATSQVKYVLSGHAADGTYAAGSSNWYRITGVGTALSSCNSSKWGAVPSGINAPITYYDFFAIAPYFNVSSTYLHNNLSSQAAVWGSDVNAHGITSSEAIADLNAFVTAVATDDTNCKNSCPNSVNNYRELIVPCLSGLLGHGIIPIIVATDLQSTRCGNTTTVTRAPSYNSNTGVVTLRTQNYLGYKAGQLWNVTGLTGTGSFNVANGLQVAAAGSSGNTLAFNVGTGLTMSFDAATGNVAGAIPAPHKQLLSYEGGWNQNNGNVFNIQSLSCASNMVTATAPGHDFSANSAIFIQNAVPSSYNGSFRAASVSGSQFTYPVASCPGAVTTFGQAIDLNSAFLQYAQRTQLWATYLTQFCQSYAPDPNLGGCGLYTSEGLNWSYAYPDTYGRDHVEGHGFYPSWTALGTINQTLP